MASKEQAGTFYRFQSSTASTLTWWVKVKNAVRSSAFTRARQSARPWDSRITGKEPAVPEDFQTRLKAELRTTAAHSLNVVAALVHAAG
jgi:hypothetical protein